MVDRIIHYKNKKAHHFNGLVDYIGLHYTVLGIIKCYCRTTNSGRRPPGRVRSILLHSLHRRLALFHPEPHPFVRLKNFDDLQNVIRTWIAARSQHAVNALVRLFELLCQLRKRNGRVDVIAKHGGVRPLFSLPRGNRTPKRPVY